MDKRAFVDTKALVDKSDRVYATRYKPVLALGKRRLLLSRRPYDTSLATKNSAIKIWFRLLTPWYISVRSSSKFLW